MNTVVNRPSCLLRLLTVTACAQANTGGMLITPAHDISKISPVRLSKQLSAGCTCHPLHLGLLAHPAESHAIFSPGNRGRGWTRAPFSLYHFNSGNVMGFLWITGQTGQTASVCSSGSRRNLQTFLSRVTQGHRNLHLSNFL